MVMMFLTPAAEWNRFKSLAWNFPVKEFRHRLHEPLNLNVGHRDVDAALAAIELLGEIVVNDLVLVFGDEDVCAIQFRFERHPVRGRR